MTNVVKNQPIMGVGINMTKIVVFILCLALPIGVGMLSGYLTSSNMTVFEEIKKPVLTPPAIVFPIAWIILYTLMGLASFFAIAGSSNVWEIGRIAIPYVIQLVLNFAWSLIFFNDENYVGAFVCLVVLWIAIVWTMIAFDSVSGLAMKLLIPYLIWVSFAGYLNLSIAMHAG